MPIIPEPPRRAPNIANGNPEQLLSPKSLCVDRFAWFRIRANADMAAIFNTISDM